MIKTEQFIDFLKTKVDFFTGTPCSYLKYPISYMVSKGDFCMSTNEGDALAACAGVKMAGKLPVIFMQNSGFGNTINAFTSLLDLYDLPVIAFISARGDASDAPQHYLINKALPGICKEIDVNYVDMPQTMEEFMLLFNTAIEAKKSTVFYIQKKTFTEFTIDPIISDNEMSRMDALEIVKNNTEDNIVLGSTGFVGRDLHSLGKRPNEFYMAGSMGHVSGIALGMSKFSDKKIVPIDGDGSIMMRLNTLITNGIEKADILHVIVDNSMHNSTGNQHTGSENVDFVQIALGAGYVKAVSVNTKSELDAKMKEFKKIKGPVLIHVGINSMKADAKDRPAIEAIYLEDIK